VEEKEQELKGRERGKKENLQENERNRRLTERMERAETGRTRQGKIEINTYMEKRNETVETRRNRRRM